ncbi:hypothetical protein BKI52_36755 [marine bacterium AO1-C]|nr:hypothetical protein BKI52_36755 [marine bacterium AO1-C]
MKAHLRLRFLFQKVLSGWGFDSSIQGNKKPVTHLQTKWRLTKLIPGLLFWCLLFIVNVAFAQPPADENFSDNTSDGALVLASPPAGRTVDGVTYVPNVTVNTAVATSAEISRNFFPTSGRHITLDPLLSALMTEFEVKSSTGNAFRMVSLDLSAFTGLAGLRTVNFTVKGYNSSGIEVATDNLDLTTSDATGSITYTKDGSGNQAGTLTFNTDWGNIVRLVFTGTTPGVGATNAVSIAIDNLDFDDAVSANTAPTASGFTANPSENLVYTFSTGDFGYNDGDGDALDHVLIETLPGAGTLYLDADNDDTYDVGEEFTANTQISKANLDAGNLQYIQNGSTNTSFQFEVNDGTENSTGNYIATLTMLAVPTVTLSILPTSRIESIPTNVNITATLSNTYGANVTVNLGFSGTATGGGVDYTVSASSITINAGATSNTTTIANDDDAIFEGNETVVIDITGVTNGTENGMQQVTYTIIDNETVPNVTFELLGIYDPTSENGGVAYISAELDAAAGVTVSVPVTFSGTATQGTDYSVSSSTIVIAAGDTKDSIAITGLNDAIEEGNETIIIDMGTPTNGDEVGMQQVTFTLSDDDAVAPRITSISRLTPATSPTNSDVLVFRVVFSEAVSNVDVTDFDPTGTTANATNVSGSGTTYDVTISGGDLASFNGTVSLGFAGGQNITDAIGIALANTTPTGTNESYVVDNTAPTFENSTPNISGITQTGFTLNIDMNEAGAAYFVVVANGAPAPTAANVRNGQANGGGAPITADNSTINTGMFVDNLLASGLTAGTPYDVYVVLEDEAGNLQASPSMLDVTTLNAEPTIAATSITFSAVTTTSMTVGWTNGNGANRMVIARAGSAVNQTPTDGTGYTANAAFGSGADLGSSNFVVFSGTGNSVTVTGLTVGTTYHFTVIEFNGTGGSANYRIAGAPTGNRSTLESEPTTAATSITFSSVAATSMTVSWTNGNGNNRLVIAREASAVNQNPTDGTGYTANAAFGSGSDLGSSNFVVYSGTGNSVNVTGLTAGTVYHFTVIEFNGSSVTANYRLTGAPVGNRSTLAAEPTTAATSITFSSVATTSMTVNWTNGNGARRVVVARASSAVNQDPVDGSGYTANAAFGSGSDLGSSNFVVYDGTGSSVSLTGLTAGTTYHFKVIEFNGTGVTANYRLTGAPAASQATPVAEPTTAATSITFSAVTTTSMTVGWTNGNGANRLVIARASSAVNQSPSDGTGYTANAAFGSGSDLGSSNFVVFSGTGNSVTVTGLTVGTTYHFTVVEFNGSGATANYFLTGAPTGNRSTLVAEPTTPASAITFSAITTGGMTVNWTNGNGARRIVVARAGFAVNQDPVDGTGYTANAFFGAGTNLGSANFVVYDGTGSSVSLTGLVDDTPYHFKVIEFNGTGATANYRLTGAPTATQATVSAEPTTAASNITFSAVTTNSMTLSWTNGNGNDRLVIAREAAAVNQSPTDGTGYTSNATFGSGSDLGGGNFVVFRGSGNLIPISGLTAGTVYHFTVIEFNGSGVTANYRLTGAPVASRSTLFAEPTTPASAITFSSVAPTSMTVNWTNGNGARRVVVAKASSAVDQNPVDGTGYTANAAFGSGDNLGSGNFVVYDGTGTSVSLTGLTAGTTYHFKVIEFNGTGVTANYRLTGAPTASQATPAAEPTTAATSITFSAVTTTSMTVGWTNGNGANRLVIARASSAVNQSPSDGTGYTANAAFGSGSDLGSSNFVVYSGTGNSVNVTGLTAGTVYHFTVIEFNGTGATANYRLTGAPVGNRSTLAAEPTTAATSITFSSVATTSMTVNWTNGNGARRVVVARASSAVNQDPVDGSGYTANAAFGSGSDLGSSNFVVYDGTGTSVSLTGLTAGTTYHFKVIEFNGTGVTANYRLTGAPTASQATPVVEPTTAATSITFSAVTTTSMTVGWTNGNGANRLVIARASSAVNQSPSDGTGYTSNAAFGSGSDLGSSNFVVFSGTGNSVNVTGLTAGTVYHFTVIEFNGSGATANYFLTGAPTGNRSTLVAEPTTPASSINFTSVTSTSMTVNWTNGNGARRVVVAKASSAVDQDPVDGTGYAANAAFGSGANLGSSNFVVYDGTGNSVNVTGLSSGVTYHFKVIEFNGTTVTANYRLTGAPTASQATPVAEPTIAATSITFSAVTATSMTVGWTNGNGSNRLVIARASSAVNQSPVDGTGYTANAAFGSGTDLGSSNFVVYGGTGNSVNVTGLSANTTYHFTVIEFSGSGATANYFLTGAPTGNRSTLAAEPTTAANTITFSAITTTGMTVNWMNGNGARRIVVAKASSAVDQDPTDGTSYTANAAFGSGSDLGSSNFVVYDGTGTSVSLTGLTAGTTYHFKVIEFNGTGATANYRLTGAPTANQATMSAEPTTAATSITFSAVTTTSMTVGWTNGNGSNRLVIAREASAVNQTPTDGTGYTANAAFGSGSDLGSGNFVVYSGTGNSVNVTGLTVGTVYHFTIIEFNGTGVTANYRLTGAPTGNRSTLVAEPTTAATSITFSSVATTSMTVNWTSGNGARRVVVAKAGSAVDQDPTDGTGYTANAAFGSGANLGSSNFVVYDGTGNSVSLTGLSSGVTYHFKVIEYNGTSLTTNYFLTGAPTASQATPVAEPTTAATSITFSAVTATSMTVGWTNGNGANRLVIAREASAVNQTPTDGTGYTANAAFGSGSDLGGNNFVVFSGTGNSVNVTGLTAGTVYHFTVIEFNGSGATANYFLTGAPVGNRSTLAAEPTIAANTISFSAITATSMTVGWTNGNGARRVVVAKASSAVDQDPVDGTSYTANAAFGSGSDLGSGNFVVYDGTGNSVTITGLTSVTTYHFKVIEYNGTGLTTNYFLTGAPTASQASADAVAPTVTSIDRQTPGTSPTNADAVTFRVIFSEDVQNVDNGDFMVAGPTGAGIGVTPVNASTYDVAISGGNMASLNATVTLTLASSPTIQDLVANALTNTTPTGTNNNTFVIDNIAPNVVSFTRKTPTNQITNADQVTFLATFSEDVQNVGMADFAATGPTGAVISVTQVTASTYDVQISGGDLAALNGTVGLNLAGGAVITDLAGNALPVAEPTTDETYTMDNSAPNTVSFTRGNPTNAVTSADQVTFRVAFDSQVINVDAADFEVTGTTATITSVTEAVVGQYDVVVSGGDLATLNGTVGLNYAAGVSITDQAGNALTGGEPGTDETYTMCNGPNNPVTGIMLGTATANSIPFTSFTASVGGATGYVIKINTSNTFTTPTDAATLPTANTAWAGAGEQAIYAGTSVTPNVTVTGLTSGITYYFKVFAYNDCGGTNTFESTGAEANTATPKADQTITFNLGADATKTFGDAPFNLNGTASSGLAVTYTSSNTTVATVSGNTVTIVGVGTTTITASQAGNTNFNAAPDVTQTLTVNKADQTITFGALANRTTGDAPFDLTATASSGLAVTYTSSNTAVATISGSTVTIVGVGTTTITASQAGDANYNAAADVTQDLTVVDAPVMSVTQGTTTLASGTGNYSFGNVDVNQSSSAITFTIANSGGVDLLLNGSPIVALSGANSSEFTVTQPTGATVAANSNTTFQIVFTPTTAGTRTATVSIANNSATNPYTFTITGEGVFAANNLAAPNLFTPNGDGNNDVFLISAPTLARVNLKIFRRQGGVVFSSNDVNEVTQIGWNGEYKGKKLPTGTYVWQITGTFQDGTPVKRRTGQVYLVR